MTTKVAVRGTLKRVRDRIAKPENWCCHSFAQDSAGKTVTLLFKQSCLLVPGWSARNGVRG